MGKTDFVLEVCNLEKHECLVCAEHQARELEVLW